MIRAKRIADKARIYYDSAVYNCASVSKTNHSLCFMVERVGPFGSPAISLIDRPYEVCIAEFDNYVIVKDGTVYELEMKRYGQNS